MPASDVTRRHNILAQIAHICVKSGLTNVVISPGSRSAPLTVAFAENPSTSCHVVVDERSAAYLSIGISQQTGKPAVLICTSGTAALNYTPAVVEAFYQQVPLLVFTADRPAEWIDQLDNQAIHQQRLYEPHLRGSYTLPVDLAHPDATWHALRIVDDAIAASLGPKPGPVHINVPLREPLYPTKGKEARGFQNAETGTADERPALPAHVSHLPSRSEPTEAGWVTLLSHWQAARHKLVVAGMHRPDEDLQDALETLGRRADVAIIGDITANLFPRATQLFHADALLGARDLTLLDSLRPDLVVSFGGQVTSKYIKEFLRDSHPRFHWRVQPGGPFPDTFQNLNFAVDSAPDYFFAGLVQRLADADLLNKYRATWHESEAAAAAAIAAFLDGAPFGEFRSVRAVLQALPPASLLHLGNSMPIRYANLVGLPPESQLAGVFSNRGTSGIDGTVSTAVGAALASGRMTTLITGDLAFFYDRNGLWHRQLPAGLRIVVINNHGGGIFDLIEGPDRLPRELHETYFLTPQPLTARRTAADHGLDYLHAADQESLQQALTTFFLPSDRPKILEVETEMSVNTQVFSDFRKMLAALSVADLS